MYMPCWSWEEVELLLKNPGLQSLHNDPRIFEKEGDVMLENIVLKRFNLIGGRIRLLLHPGHTCKSLERELVIAISEMSKSNIRRPSLIDNKGITRSLCYSMVPEPSTGGDGLLFDYECMNIDFCSKRASLLAYEVLQKNLKNKHHDMLDIFRNVQGGGGFRGVLFENLAHSLIIDCKKEELSFQCRHLKNEKGDKVIMICK